MYGFKLESFSTQIVLMEYSLQALRIVGRAQCFEIVCVIKNFPLWLPSQILDAKINQKSLLCEPNAKQK